MTRTLLGVCLALAQAGAARAAGPVPAGSPGRENPAIVALREYTATLRTNFGEIAVDFYPDDAPNTVRTFLKLAQQGFYDGKPVYGVFPGRMLLVGTPPGDGEAPQRVKYEPGTQPQEAGTLAMDRLPAEPGKEARPSVPARFFINLVGQSHLDGDYTVFAKITEGLEVARKIGGARTRPEGGCPAPLEDIVLEQVVVARRPKAQDEKETPE
jgi:cyclophilin family peptidyl-prolyl cis-trans isomerase